MKILFLLFLLGLVFSYDRKYKKPFYIKRRCKKKCKNLMKKYVCRKCFKFKKKWRKRKVKKMIPYKIKKCKRVGRRRKCIGGRRRICKPKKKCYKTKGHYFTYWKKMCRQTRGKRICRRKPKLRCWKRRVWKVVGKKKVCKRGKPYKVCFKKYKKYGGHGHSDYHGEHGVSNSEYGEFEGEHYGEKYGEHHGDYDGGYGKSCKWKQGRMKCYYVPIKKYVTVKKCRRYMGKKCIYVPGKVKCRRFRRKRYVPGKLRCKHHIKCFWIGRRKRCWLTKGRKKCWFNIKYRPIWIWKRFRPYWKKVYTGKTKCKFAGIKPLGWTKHPAKCYPRIMPYIKPHTKPYFGAKK